MSSGGPLLRARGVTVHRRDRPVVDDVDLDLDPGEVVLLRGPSGSGKSTLLQALAGIAHVAPGTKVTGTVHVKGTELQQAPSAKLARRVGTLFQRVEDQLLALDAETEVALKLQGLGIPPDEAGARARKALRRVDAGHLADRGTATLSGGEAKRVALAAALAADPPVLVLDEPLGHLDPPGEERFRRILRELPSHHGVVMAEHRGDALGGLAPRILHLQPGHLVADRTAPAPEPRPFRHPPSEGPALRLEGVTAGPGDAPILRDLHLDLAGGLVGLAGPNGAGKTTLLKLLAGFLTPLEGRVLLDGRDLADLPPRERARRIGYAPQDPASLFFQPTVRRELTYGPRNLGVTVDVGALAGDHELAPHLERHPHTLSGGEAERLAWAASHAHDPPVVLLDEPTTGLDHAARRVLRRTLARARRRGIAVVATHDRHLLAAADRIILLDGGAVVADGPPQDVLDPASLPPGLRAFAPPREVAP